MKKLLSNNGWGLTLVLLAILVGLAKLSAKPEGMEISLSANTRPEDAQPINIAAKQLADRCPGLVRYQRDLTQGDVAIAEALDYQKQQWQWTGYVSFKFNVADDPIFIPAAFRAGGHHCEYRIGIDGTPAVDTAKQECELVCKGE